MNLNIWCKEFEKASGNEKKILIVKDLANALRKIKNENITKYEQFKFKRWRKSWIKRKIRNYNRMEKVAEYVYMYILRKPSYYIKKILKCDLKAADSFYTKQAYYYEYVHDVWEGYWGDSIIDQFDAYNDIFESLSDSKSKEVLVHIMMARLTNDWKYYKMCCDNSEKGYFDKEIFQLMPEQVVVDGGGYDGDTFERFCHFYGKDYVKHWYFYEPDALNMQKAQKLLNNEKGIIFRKAGLSDTCGKIHFAQTGTVGSKCSESGKESIDVVSIDEDIEEKVTFIKLDIEGKELDALKGAKKQITENTPILAICLYHKKNDILELTEYIKEINPSYKLYIRHYSESHWDTILYAK